MRPALKRMLKDLRDVLYMYMTAFIYVHVATYMYRIAFITCTCSTQLKESRR